MFQKIFVANRGEIARRIIRACNLLEIQSVVAFSDADSDFSYLKEASKAVNIGPGPARLSYLNQTELLQAAEKTECEALHPGYGFFSENALFATRCWQQKLKFIGPSASHIRLMGDKAFARQTMKEAGLQVMPGSEGVLHSCEEATKKAQEIGYPVLLKATAGGGGKGMRRVDCAKNLKAAFEEASLEAEKAFSNKGLYLEKYIESGRHIEFQILADHYGTVLYFPERDCSIQRRHQKLLEESPAVGFLKSKKDSIGKKVCSALKRIGYEGVGTVEFLMDKKGELYFIEMNTRIQVEHPVTEMVTGVDLVAWQIRIAAGERLSFQQKDIKTTGHAIECRLNAEDVANDFKPSLGVIKRLVLPKLGKDVRFDTHIESGCRISSYYDSMIGKLITHGKDRKHAIEKMAKALGQLEVQGIHTTKKLQSQILKDTKFQEEGYDCGYFGEMTWQK